MMKITTCVATSRLARTRDDLGFRAPAEGELCVRAAGERRKPDERTRGARAKPHVPQQCPVFVKWLNEGQSDQRSSEELQTYVARLEMFQVANRKLAVETLVVFSRNAVLP